MREVNGKAHNELNSLPAGSRRQEYKQRPELTRHGEKLKLETQDDRCILSQEPREQRDQRGAGDKIHDIKMELSSLAREQEGNVISSQQDTRLIKEKLPTLMDRFMDGLKKLKEWFARRRREKIYNFTSGIPRQTI